MIGPKVPAMNEDAVANMVTDMTFLEGEITRIGRGHLNSSFTELHSVCTLNPRRFLALMVLADGQDYPYRYSAGLSERKCSTNILQRSQAKKAASTFGETCQVWGHPA
jgi:hypothetical protein